MAESEPPSDVIRTALRETIESEFKVKNYKINISSASKAGENNFVAVIYRVSFNKDGDNEHKKLILKIAPQNVSRRVVFSSRTCFLREIYMYNEVS